MLKKYFCDSRRVENNPYKFQNMQNKKLYTIASLSNKFWNKLYSIYIVLTCNQQEYENANKRRPHIIIYTSYRHVQQ